VGGLPCAITSVTARNVTCNVPRQYGLIRAEYWALPWGQPKGLPDFASLGQPGEAPGPAAAEAESYPCRQHLRAC
jgi:hypothetical protein